MEKEIKNYRNNLIILSICFVLVIISNLHLFYFGSIIKMVYGIVLILLGMGTFYALKLISTNILASVKIASVIGPIMAMISFIEGFNYANDFIVNFRIGCLFFMIGGVLLYFDSKKICKYYKS